MGFPGVHLQVKLFLQKPSSTQERIGGVAGDKFHQQSPFLLKSYASLNVFFFIVMFVFGDVYTLFETNSKRS